ncbi:MAG: type I phosphomannose isomerase catalytic subunit [Acetivibrio ethanolgignens]
MEILKLIPACKDYLWGGTRLKTEFGKNFVGEKLAETWELSTHEAGASIIAEGKDSGRSLPSYIEKYGKEILGTRCQKFEHFPILIKLIDAKDNLSIQVHPDNEYAKKYEKDYGKTEFWYVVDCEEGAYLYYGFSKTISKGKLRDRIENQTLLEVLNKVQVKKGDSFFIEAGTIHAIGAGILIAEIQQSSNVTYRVYDYGRVGADGKQRELHIDKALDVIYTAPIEKEYDFGAHLGVSDYFIVDKLDLDGTYSDCVSEESFLSILVLDGTLTVKTKDDVKTAVKGDSLMLLANSGEYCLEGKADVIMTVVGK